MIVTEPDYQFLTALLQDFPAANLGQSRIAGSLEYGLAAGWGHSTYRSATLLAIQAGVRSFGLFHHDPDHDDQSIEQILQACQKEIALSKKNIHCFAAQEGGRIRV